METYKSGSRWRKWDLHLHTPETLKEDKYSGNTPEEKWNTFCSDINKNEAEISVVGITDYLLIDNYKKFLSLVDEGKITKKFDLIIPNIELRLTPITADGKALNLHLLIDPAFVPQLDARIFSKLKLKNGNTTYDASKNSLIRLGKTINSSFSDEEAYKEGARKFVIDFDTLKEVFDNDVDLHKHCLIVVSNSSNDGATGITDHSSFFTGNASDLDVKRQAVYKLVDAIFSGNPSDYNYFLGKSNSDTKDVVIKKCGSLKPCIHGCDAHTNSKVFNPDQKRFCWIKANPTFEGLRQIIFEPQERVAIQELIPDEKELYRVIDRIEISNSCFTSTPIELNPNLNVIIGSRSSGKTTLLNSIAKAIDSTEFYERNKKAPVLIEPPKMNVFWLDGAQSDSKEIQKGITYIPQNYINSLAEATEDNAPILAIAESALFDNQDEISKKRGELDSRVESLNRIINADVYQLFIIRKQISEQKEKIKKIGDKKGIEEQIKKIDLEIAKLQKDLTKEEAKLLTELRKEYSENNKIIESLESDSGILSQELIDINEDTSNVFIDRGIEFKSKELTNEFNIFLQGTQKQYIDGYLSFIKEKDKKIVEEIKNLKAVNKKILDDNGVLIKKSKQNTSAEQKVKEKDIQDKKLIEIEKAEVSLKTLEESLSILLTKIIDSHKVRSEARNEFITIAKGNLEGIEYSAVVGVDNLKLNKFLVDTINFHNSVDARPSLSLLDGYKTDDQLNQSALVKNENIKTVIDLIMADLLKTKSGIDIQKAVEGILDDFEFINYSLKYEDDLFVAMTPGKKSLVVLKLLVESSKDKYPILIDQPEDDLDSRSISGEIVEFLRTKKKDRQIILVTHNANIAIKADAEEIIVANRHGQQHKNKDDTMFDYTSGAIENSFINKTAINTLEKMGIREHACELLEGGEEAFENRKNKYNLK